MADRAEHESFLATGAGLLTLVLLCGVQFLDVVDGSIVNVALPSIQRDLHFSQQNLQWVASGYVLTYGGFLLLGGRMADLLGRRRLLVSGVLVFACCSLAGGLAQNEATLISARIVQGIGAALMAPAALSLVTTLFKEGVDRHKALGIWGAIAGLGAAAGVFFGGVLSEGPGWRWVLLVNLPFCALILAGAFLLLGSDRPERARGGFDVRGAALVTGGMLLLVYALVEAPSHGWSNVRTIGELATAAALLGGFLVNEARSSHPLMPLSIFRVRGLAAADATQLIAFAGFYSMFFFLTLYMQNVLHWSPIQAGAAYLPVTAGLGFAASVSPRLFARFGTRPVIVAGALLSAGAVYYLSRIPVHGSYLTDIFPGLIVMSLGLGAIFVGATVAANAGVPSDRSGLAAGLLNTSLQLGIALGLAAFSALATARTNHLLAAHASGPDALVGGYTRALLAASIFLAAAALIALRTLNSRGESTAAPDAAPVIGGDRVKYMLQVRFNGAGAVIHGLPAAEQEKIVAEFIAIQESPGVLDGNRLGAAGSGVTVRVHAGQTRVTEGPAVDRGGELDGYYIYEAPDIDAAIAFAARIPVVRLGGSVEVRTMVER